MVSVVVTGPSDRTIYPYVPRLRWPWLDVNPGGFSGINTEAEHALVQVNGRVTKVFTGVATNLDQATISALESAGFIATPTGGDGS